MWGGAYNAPSHNEAARPLRNEFASRLAKRPGTGSRNGQASFGCEANEFHSIEIQFL